MTAAAVVKDIEETKSSSSHRLAIAAVAVAAVGAIVFASGFFGGRVTTDDAFVQVPMVYVASQVPGRVIEILVAEHQRVAEGDVLFRLDAAEYEIGLLRSDATLALARNHVIKAKAASASADAERKAATVELWRSEKELTRMQLLLASNSSSQRDLETAQAARDAAQARVRALELRVEAELALLNDDALVRQAEAEQRAAQLNLSRAVVRAPYSGTVGRRNIEIGAVVRAGQPLLALVSDREVYVMANFKETQLSEVRIGLRAEVTIDAFPDVVWGGRVESFSPATGAEYSLLAPEPAAGNFTKVVQRVPVKIVLDKVPIDGDAPDAAGLNLAAGLSAEVSISIE